MVILWLWLVVFLFVSVLEWPIHYKESHLQHVIQNLDSLLTCHMTPPQWEQQYTVMFSRQSTQGRYVRITFKKHFLITMQNYCFIYSTLSSFCTFLKWAAMVVSCAHKCSWCTSIKFEDLFKGSWLLMIVNNILNFHSLSFTVTFAFKQFMIVDDRWQNMPWDCIIANNHDIWNFGQDVASWRITKAYQEIMRILTMQHSAKCWHLF